jgi:hypothetical protein
MDEKTREELLELLKQCNPRQRSTIIQVIEGRASEDNVGYIKEELAFLEPDMTTRRVTFMSARQCDCGKVVSAKNPLTGVCQHPGCKKFTCSECSRICVRCNRTCCSDHSSIYPDGEVYCRRCRFLKWLKIFFDIGNERSKK